MKKELTIEHLAAYLPYHPQLISRNGDTMRMGGVDVDFSSGHISITNAEYPTHYMDSKTHKLLLRPLSQLTETIEHGGEMFVPIEYFEIGDGHNDSLEYDYGNIKLINTLESIAEQEAWQDCDFLPNGVVKYLHSLHFDTFGLIESGLAEPIPSIEQP
jgi:hypothetical protein